MPSVLNSTRQVAIQGIAGSFHDLAARVFFGDDLEFAMCDSFPELFRSMESDRASFGVMAIENTVAGTLLPNYALLRDSNYRIIGEVYLRIEHQLMALPGQSLSKIKEVHSHPMALLQCQAFFREHPQMHLIESPDTAGSAAWLKEHALPGKAAIASESAAEIYGLEILASGIETNKRNFTRFLIIGDPSISNSLLVEPNKSSLSFNLSHTVGSLSQILLVLSAHGMNLSKIQSLPIVGQEWEYFFHIDLEFEDFAQYKRSLDAIRPLVDELKILGEYPRGNKNV